jgi:hypothetical protein
MLPSAPAPRLAFRLLALAALSPLLAACGGGMFDSGSGGGLSGFMQSVTPASAPAAVDDPDQQELECPPVIISPGGAALRIGGGSSDSVRSQITITDVARECARGPGGSVVVKLGAEGRVLVGPAGSAGALGATMRIEVRNGDKVLSSRAVRVGATVPSGQSQAAWAHVENGIQIPASAFTGGGDTDVFVTLNAGAAEPRRRR